MWCARTGLIGFVGLLLCSGNVLAQTRTGGRDDWLVPPPPPPPRPAECQHPCHGDFLIQGRLAMNYNRTKPSGTESLSAFLFGVETKFGYMLADVFALGLGLGASYMEMEGDEDLPDIKGMAAFGVGPRAVVLIPTGGSVRPYFDFQVGFSYLYLEDLPDGTGMHLAPSLGILAMLKDGLFLDVGIGYIFQYLDFSWGTAKQHNLPFLIGFGGVL